MIELTRNQKIGFGFGVAGVLAITFALVLYFVVIKKDTPKPPIKSSGSTKVDSTKVDTDPIAKAEAASKAKADADARAAAAAKDAADAKAEADAKVKADAKDAADAAAAAVAAAKAAVARAKDLEAIEIEGNSFYSKDKQPLRHSAHNNNPERKKDRLIDTNQGCWTFLNVYPNLFKLQHGNFNDPSDAIKHYQSVVFITKLTLPSDVRAEAWGFPWNADNGLCQGQFTLRARIEPGDTKTFEIPSAMDIQIPGRIYVCGLKFFKVEEK